MKIPNTYTAVNETDCCAVPNIAEWHDKEISFDNKHFIRMYTMSFLYMPLNMAKIMTAIQKQAEDAGATMPAKEVMILSREVSPWKAEQLYAVAKPVEGADNVTLNKNLITQVYEGKYKDAGKWHKSLLDFAKKRGKQVDTTYFFYTTCPKCAEHYGKNYVIGLASVM